MWTMPFEEATRFGPGWSIYAIWQQGRSAPQATRSHAVQVNWMRTMCNSTALTVRKACDHAYCAGAMCVYTQVGKLALALDQGKA